MKDFYNDSKKYIKLYVLNSAVMPKDGKYTRIQICKEEAAKLLQEADEIVSSISYPEVCKILSEISGVNVPLDEEKKMTLLQEDICHILVAKLRFRIKSERKGIDRITDVEEYEFFHIVFNNCI